LRHKVTRQDRAGGPISMLAISEHGRFSTGSCAAAMLVRCEQQAAAAARGAGMWPGRDERHSPRADAAEPRRQMAARNELAKT